MKKLVALALILGCESAWAYPLTWTFENTLFDDGGQVIGSFDYDAETKVFSNIDIITTAGSVGVGAVYTDCLYDSVDHCLDQNAGGIGLILATNGWMNSEPGSAFLVFAFSSELRNAGGSVNLSTSSGCFLCEQYIDPDAYRDYSGQVSAVPIPAAAYLFASGLGLLGWFRRRQTA